MGIQLLDLYIFLQFAAKWPFRSVAALVAELVMTTNRIIYCFYFCCIFDSASQTSAGSISNKENFNHCNPLTFDPTRTPLQLYCSSTVWFPLAERRVRNVGFFNRYFYPPIKASITCGLIAAFTLTPTTHSLWFRLCAAGWSTSQPVERKITTAVLRCLLIGGCLSPGTSPTGEYVHSQNSLGPPQTEHHEVVGQSQDS